MAKSAPLKNSFNAGEFSPRLFGRPDLKRYANAVSTGLNMVSSVQGDIINRSGTMFVAEVKDSTKATRLIEFVFSTSQAYVIEVGDLYFRFYRNNERIEVATVPVEVVTPYLEADLFQLKIAQSADVLYITHPDYAPRKLERTSDTVWNLSVIDFQDGPYLLTNITDTTLTPSGTTGSINVTASAITGINSDTGFQSTDVGRLIRLKDSAGDWTWVKITGHTSTTVVTGTIVGQNLANTTAITDWRLGVWSDTTGYPACVTFFEDRLWFGGGYAQQRLDGSVSGDYETFSPTDVDGTVLDDNSIAYTLNANKVNAIRWMLDDEKGLLVGTVGGEWVLRASSLQEAVTPSNVQAKRSSTYGSADIMSVRAGKAVLFVQSAGRKLREMAYLFEADGFEAPDMTMFSDHITSSGLVELAYQQEPQSTIWAVRGDGALLSFIYERSQDVIGWYKHEMGGTDVAVESVAAIPVTGRDQLWQITSRTVDGSTVRYVEYHVEQFGLDTDQEDAFFVDCGLTYSGAAATIISGLDHLEGEEVTILVNGATHPNKTVVSGSITLDREATKAHIGLAYTAKGASMRFESGSQDGTAQGKTQRIHKVTFRLLRSLGGKVGPSFTELDPIPFRAGGDPMDAPPPLFTGDLKVDWDSGYSTEQIVCFQQDQPLPLWILAIMPQMRTYDA